MRYAQDDALRLSVMKPMRLCARLERNYALILLFDAALVFRATSTDFAIADTPSERLPADAIVFRR